MSHVSRYKIKCKDLITLKRVLTAKGIKCRENCNVSLYGRNKVDAALAFKLDGWRYEVAVDKDGMLLYDHYGSSGDSFHRLGEVVQDYNKEVIMAKVWGIASNVWTESVEDGLKIVVEV